MTLADPGGKNQAWKGEPVGRLTVNNIQNLRGWSGCSGKCIGSLTPKMFRWRPEARSIHATGEVKHRSISCVILDSRMSRLHGIGT